MKPPALSLLLWCAALFFALGSAFYLARTLAQCAPALRWAWLGLVALGSAVAAVLVRCVLVWWRWRHARRRAHFMVIADPIRRLRS